MKNLGLDLSKRSWHVIGRAGGRTVLDFSCAAHAQSLSPLLAAARHCRVASVYEAGPFEYGQWTRDQIESGKHVGEPGFKGKYDKVVTVKSAHVLAEVKKWSGKGYTVFVDGVCAANCGK